MIKIPTYDFDLREVPEHIMKMEVIFAKDLGPPGEIYKSWQLDVVPELQRPAFMITFSHMAFVKNVIEMKDGTTKDNIIPQEIVRIRMDPKRFESLIKLMQKFNEQVKKSKS